MPARYVVARIVAAVAITGGALALIPQTAHAGTGSSASATLQCEQIPASQWQTANWHVHVQADSSDVNGTLFGFFVDGVPANPQYVLPGQTFDTVLSSHDGNDTQIIVAANGIPLVTKTSELVCNPQTASAVFSCGQSGLEPQIDYTMTNPSPSNYLYTVNYSGGVQLFIPVTAGTKTATEALAQGVTYHATIDLYSNKVAEVSGFAQCGPQGTTTTTTIKPTTTTTSTTIPPTTTTTLPPTTTTTVVKQGTPPTTNTPTTSTTVAAKKAGDPPASSTSTTADPPAALPFTGGSSVPMGAAGFASVLFGAVVLVIVRRRSVRA
jgi:hypothetical protein